MTDHAQHICRRLGSATPRAVSALPPESPCDAREVRLRGPTFDFVEMLCQARDLFDDPLSDGRIELLELSTRILRMRGLNALTQV